MSLNGSGTYVVNSAGQPVVASTLITAAAFNAFTADIATALSTAVFKDGQQTITANLPMGGFRLTGVGSGNSSRTMSASTGDLQDNLANWAGTAGGTANALTLTPTPAITAYLAGQSFVFKAGASANTTTTTVAVSGLTAIAVQANGAACAGGEIQASRWYRVTLDSTSTCQVEPLGVNAPAQGGTGVANNAASTITISGAYPLTVTLTASTGVTFPTSGTLITTSGTETLTNKTFNLSNNTLTGTTAQFNAALSDNDFATLAGSESLTNKTVNLSSNTLTGTTAQFNTALSDNDFATLAGSESLTNKKLGSLTSNGFVKTGSGDGTLSVDTATYITSALETGTWSAPARSIDTAYQNTSGKKRRLLITCFGPLPGIINVDLLMDSSTNPPTTVRATGSGETVTTARHRAIFATEVPSGWYYKVLNNAGGAIGSWFELDE